MLDLGSMVYRAKVVGNFKPRSWGRKVLSDTCKPNNTQSSLSSNDKLRQLYTNVVANIFQTKCDFKIVYVRVSLFTSETSETTTYATWLCGLSVNKLNVS